MRLYALLSSHNILILRISTLNFIASTIVPCLTDGCGLQIVRLAFTIKYLTKYTVDRDCELATNTITVNINNQQQLLREIKPIQRQRLYQSTAMPSLLTAGIKSRHVASQLSSLLIRRRQHQTSGTCYLSSVAAISPAASWPKITPSGIQIHDQSESLHRESTRSYTNSRPVLNDESDDVGGGTEGGGEGGEAVAVQKDTSKIDEKKQLRAIALEFGSQRASYRRQVKQARKEYMAEYLKHKKEDEEQRETEQAAITRRRLERQRRKNERSVENARRQVELRRQANLAFQDHLKVQQERRDAHKDLMRRARQILIDELEEEAPLWMTTPEEVEAAFTHEAEQLLWARPQGVIGVPNPSPDSHFWSYQGHTWDMSKTYKTQSQLLLEEMEDEAYWATNIDPNVWTPERIAEHEAREQKAQLRSNVRLEGRKSLLKRQRDYLQQDNETMDGEPPKPMPVPSLGVLANTKAQEAEGSKLLMEDPTKFFVFENSGTSVSSVPDGDEESSDTYAGPSLGTPVDILDPLRTGKPQGRVFPIGVGKLPKPDLRSEKEKKRQEREERLWAAAQAKSNESDELDLVAEEDREIGEPLDYENNDDWDSDDEEWAKGLDPEKDEDILNVPRELRYREEDIDSVIESLEKKAQIMQSHVQNTIQTMEQEARSRLDRKAEEIAMKASDSAAASDEETLAASSPSFFDDETVEALESVGADAEKYDKIMSSLTHEQLLSLFALEAKARESPESPALSSEAASSKTFETIPGLTEEQIVGLTELDSFLKVAEASQK